VSDKPYYAVSIHSDKADVYRVLRAYQITDPCVAHAIKKLLRCGRCVKDMKTDIREAIKTLQRWEEMESEDAVKMATV